MSCGGAAKSPVKIYDAQCGNDDPDGGPENPKTLHVHIYLLNKKLRRFGLAVRANKGAGATYQLRHVFTLDDGYDADDDIAKKRRRRVPRHSRAHVEGRCRMGRRMTQTLRPNQQRGVAEIGANFAGAARQIFQFPPRSRSSGPAPRLVRTFMLSASSNCTRPSTCCRMPRSALAW